MTFLYILLAVYIVAVNFYSFWLVKTQREEVESGDRSKGDSKILIAALLGGATAIYASMFAFRYRLESILLMILIPVLAVLNIYTFFLGFRGIYLFI